MGIIIFIFGLFCFLWLIGNFFTWTPAKFAWNSILTLGGLIFIVFIVAVAWAFWKNSDSQQNKDAFPYSQPDMQYAWYDRHNVPMSDRCYTTLKLPCTDLDWEKALNSE